MCHIVLSFVFPLVLPNFSTLSLAPFSKKVIEYKMCLVFSTTLTQNTSHLKNHSAIYCHKCKNIFMQSTCYSFQVLMKLEFSQQTFEESTNIRFHQNPSSGSQVVPCGRADTTKLIVTFRNFANPPKSVS
jgi:hypothetical protein